MTPARVDPLTRLATSRTRWAARIVGQGPSWSGFGLAATPCGTQTGLGPAGDQRALPVLDHGEHVVTGEGLVRLQRVRQAQDLAPVLGEELPDPRQQPGQ